MYIAYIKEIDGFQIITGVDIKGIDPVETDKIILPLLEQSQEMTAKKTKISQINSYQKLNNGILKSVINLHKQVMQEKNINDVNESDLSSNQLETYKSYENSKSFNDNQIESLRKDLPQIEQALFLKRAELTISNAVYQETARNQIDIIKDQYDDYKIKLISIKQYFDNTKKRQFLVSTGDIIDDNRGRVVWEKDDKWKKRTLQFLSDIKELPEIWEDELTEEQRQEIAVQVENERVEALSPEDNEAEKNTMIEAALRQSVQMKSELEIQGDPDALQIAQDWYNAEVLLIEERYS